MYFTFSILVDSVQLCVLLKTAVVSMGIGVGNGGEEDSGTQPKAKAVGVVDVRAGDSARSFWLNNWKLVKSLNFHK